MTKVSRVGCPELHQWVDLSNVAHRVQAPRSSIESRVSGILRQPGSLPGDRHRHSRRAFPLGGYLRVPLAVLGAAVAQIIGVIEKVTTVVELY